MRILLFTSSYFPRKGGLETVTRELARHLVSRGHAVTVATNRYPHVLKSFETLDGIEVYRQLYPDVLPGGPTSMVAALRRGAMLALTPVALVRLALLIRRVRPDVVNVHYFSSPAIYALLVARLAGIPTVLSFHGSDVTQVRRGLHTLALRGATRSATMCTTCSQDLRDRLMQVARMQRGDEVVAVPNGIDREEVAPEPVDVPESFVLVVARLVEAKGVDIAITSIGLLARRGITMPLLIVGDGPQRSALQQMSRDLGLDSLISFIGQLEAPRVRALIRRSWCVVVPSRWEGFGLVCLEAMIEARPVVATRVGGIPEIVVDGETGILVPPENAEALAQTLLSLRESGDRARQMGCRGQRRALEQYSWEGVADGYLSVYQAASARSRSA